MNSYNKQALDIIAKEQGFIRDNLEKVFHYTNAAGNNDGIKIEINYSDRCHILPAVETHVSNGKKYIPELLFEDKVIVDRIKFHPMALWKTRSR